MHIIDAKFFDLYKYDGKSYQRSLVYQNDAGYDVTGISPDGRYVRVATGFDYRDAAPISGMSFGARDKSMVVSLRVEQ